MSQLIYKGPPKTLRAVATLTGSLVASDDIDVSADSYVSITIDYVKGGSATLLEVVPEVQLQGDSTWRPVSAQNAGTPSGGAVAVELVAITYTLGATGSREFSVPVFGQSKIRVQVRETGTPGGTCAVTAVASRVGA